MRKVFEVIGMFFPVASIEICNTNLCNGFRVETADIDADPVGVGARDVKGLDATVGAKTVLGDTGVECVGGEVLFTLNEPESGGGHNQMEVGGHRTDRTIAELGFDLRRRVHLEPDPTTVAAAGVGDEV